MHVDDFLWTGSKMIKSMVIDQVTQKFRCGKDMDNTFRYIGLNIEQNENEIHLQQHEYTEELKQVNRSDLASANIREGLYAELVGQLHWIASQSRPDVSFDVLELYTLTDVLK